LNEYIYFTIIGQLSRLREVEEILMKRDLELEEVKESKCLLEKRIESMKQNAKISREENAKANEDIEVLSSKIEELQSEVSLMT